MDHIANVHSPVYRPTFIYSYQQNPSFDTLVSIIYKALKGFSGEKK